ncbi:DUF3445 domain-containing protein [Devosia sp. MC532]|uniref:heme-dependent oxidative N-demethylase family protein n=1 Tax=Devosia sp. MC532 TaxID=2799788 RepID=UPI0018F6CC0B|nr:DUF3445 domain-containing protein [Devosia sp. MC532]MBJ7579497.1 DUF3445 domain-containing protein [Devosia sp. MC532]
MTISTPYDGSSKLFQIGTKPISPDHWLEPDICLAAQLREKDRLLTEYRPTVYAEQVESYEAQQELLSLITQYLPEAHPGDYQRHVDGLAISAINEVRPITGKDSPLLTAARLVQDDLLILQRDTEAWRLTAACLCFPSSWLLAEKIGKPLADIHAPVPGFGPGTRAAQIMARMFDAARPETPMIRWNYSLYGDDRLFHPESTGPTEPRFGAAVRADPIFMRVERQTLRKLPKTGALAFTIRVSVDPIEKLSGHPRQGEIAHALIDQINALSEEQLDYKGLTREKPRVIERLIELVTA